MADRFSLDSTPVELADVDGFRIGVAECGLKSGGPDLGVILCEEGGCGTAIFSSNTSRAASVQVSRPRALAGRLRAVIVNSGNANCFTGEKGLQAAREMVSLAATGLDVPEEQLLVASVGEAGVPLSIKKLTPGIKTACTQALDEGKGDFASVIVPVGVARRAVSASGVIDGKPFRVAGVTRGLNLADTGMANVFAFVVTDAAVEPDFLAETVVSVHDASFGRLIVDAGVGTNDTLCVLCSGRAGNEPLADLFSAGSFVETLGEVIAELAFDLAFSAPGPTRLIDVQVSGAASDEDAETVARAIADSTLVRIAVHAGRPCWELILAAAGRSGGRVVESRATIRMAGTIVYDRGRPAEHSSDSLVEDLDSPRAAIELDIGLGEGSAGIFTCTLSDGADMGAGTSREQDADDDDDNDDDDDDGASDETGVDGKGLARLRAELAEKIEQLDDIEWEHAKELREVKREAIEDAESADDIPAEMQKLVEDLEEELEKARNSRRPAAPADAASSSEGEGGDPAIREELEQVRAELEEKDDQVKDLEWEHAKELREAKRGGSGEGDSSGSDSDSDSDGEGSAELEARIAELEKELKDARKEAEAAAASGDGESDAADLREKLDAACEELEEARAELEKKGEEIKDLEWEHAKELREAKRDAGESGGSSSDDGAAETKARIAELEKDIKEAKEELAADPGGSNMEILEKINDLQAELEEVLESYDASDDASGDDSAASEETARLREELDQANAALALKTQLIEQFKSEQSSERTGDEASSGADKEEVARLREELDKAKEELAAKAEIIEKLETEQSSEKTDDEASSGADEEETARLRGELDKAKEELALKAQLIEQFKSEQSSEKTGDEASSGVDEEETARLREELDKAKEELAAKAEIIEKLESEQSSGEAGGEASPDTDKLVKALEKKLEKANAKLLKRAEKIAELREKIGATSGK